jgi:hypothetical protein
MDRLEADETTRWRATQACGDYDKADYKKRTAVEAPPIL